MPECPVCGAEVELGKDTVQGELIECSDCGTELEVTKIDPFEVSEAPQEEEDWGQ
ncbi:MAG: lysine biosynthesis protein LysW [Melioribacteraceae bacterium]